MLCVDQCSARSLRPRRRRCALTEFATRRQCAELSTTGPSGCLRSFRTLVDNPALQSALVDVHSDTVADLSSLVDQGHSDQFETCSGLSRRCPAPTSSGCLPSYRPTRLRSSRPEKPTTPRIACAHLTTCNVSRCLYERRADASSDRQVAQPARVVSGGACSCDRNVTTDIPCGSEPLATSL